MTEFVVSIYDSTEVNQIESALSHKPWKIGTRKIDYSTGLEYVWDGNAWQVLPMGQFTVGGTIVGPTVKDFYVWTAPYNCTVLSVKGYQDVGSGSTFNAFSGSLGAPMLLLSSNATIGAADSLVDGGAVQNTSVTKGTNLYVRIATLVGSPTQVAIRIYLSR